MGVCWRTRTKTATGVAYYYRRCNRRGRRLLVRSAEGAQGCRRDRESGLAALSTLWPQPSLVDLTWDANAPPGFVNSGNFILTSYYYDADPYNGGNFVADAGTQQAAYQAGVTPAPVPEGSTWQSLGVLLFLGGILGIRRQCQ